MLRSPAAFRAICERLRRRAGDDRRIACIVML
jgi:hypothetical protein